jgi:hypothetical protein
MKKYISLILFIVLELIVVIISSNDFIINNSTLLSVFTAIFLIVVPILYYLLTNKKQTEFTFWFVFYLAFKITPYVFSMKNNFFEMIFRLKIYLNIAFLIFLIWKAIVFIGNFRKSIKQKNNVSQDEYSIISNYLQKSVKFKNLGKMIAFEVCSFYYCFIKWTGNKSIDNQYSGYKNSGVSAIYIGLMLVSIIEAIGVHVLLISWNKNVAILFLVLHIYLLINLTGQLKAIIFRKHLILSQKIIIRYGLFETLEIAISSINKINKFEGDYEKSKELVKFALLGKLEPHNIYLELKNDTQINLPFGIIKKPKIILLYIDNVNDFIKQVMDKMEEKERYLATANHYLQA